MTNDNAIIYVPSDTPEAMAMAPRRVAAVPLIVRGIMTLADAGIGSCTLIIASSQRERIEQALARYRPERLPDIDIIPYEETYRITPAMIERAAERMNRRALLINANLLFDRELVRTIYQHDPNDDRIFVCKEGVHPLPIMEVTVDAWRSLAPFALASPRSIESCVEHLKTTRALFEVQKPATVNTFLLKRREDIPVAEKFLAEAIRRSTNGFVARHINKRLSLPVSMILSKLWTSPHAVTCINIVVGLLSGVFLAGRGYTSLLIGASLFQLASIADGVDGEIAKLTFRSSKFGQYIDTVSDNLALASMLVGLTIGSYRTLETGAVLIAGGVAIAGIGVIVAMMLRFLKRNTNSASLVTFDREYLQKRATSDHPVIMGFLRTCKHFAKKDIFSFMIFACAIAGILPYWIFSIAFGGLLGSAALIYLNAADAAKPRRRAQSWANATGTTAPPSPRGSNEKKMFVFDFDGTLVNSMDKFADIAAEVMPRYYTISPHEARASYLRTSGIPFFQQLDALFPGNPNNERAANEFETIKKRSYFQSPVYTDAAETIRALRARNIKVAVSSNNFQDLVDQYIERTGIRFDAVLGYRTGFAKGEDHFRHIEKEYGIKRHEMTFVGDSLKDGERAQSAGVAFIAKEGTFNQDEFTKHFPDAPVVRSLSELKGMV